MKGQIQQVFIYLLTIIIVGMILLIGYKAINGLVGKSCDVEKVKFQSNLESFITKYSSYGTQRTQTMKTPCSVASVCFVNASSIEERSVGVNGNGNTIINSSVVGGIKENIFLVSTELTEPIGYMSEINVKNDVVCINNKNGKFYLKFEGLGKTTIIGASQ